MNKLLINLQNDDSSVDRVVASLRALHKKPVTAAQLDDVTISAINTLNRLKNDLQNAKNELAELYQYNEIDYELFSARITTGIISNNAALQASIDYSREWFQSLPYSLEAKITLATLLIAKVAPFNASYVNNLWIGLVDRKIDSLNAVRYIYKG